MNTFLLIAGILGTLGGLAHTILGDRWTVAPLEAEAIASRQNTGEQNKRYLRWWWHMGSVLLLSTSVAFAAHGAALVELQRHLLLYLAFLWIATTTVFFTVALRSPNQAWSMVPGLVGIPINALILAGLFI